MTHQQRMSRSGSTVNECAVSKWRQRLPLAFVLEENILRHDVIKIFIHHH